MALHEIAFEHGRRFSRHRDFDAYLIELYGESFREYRRRWNAAAARETAAGELGAAPIHLSLELSDACNLNCIFCYRHVSGEKATNAHMPPEMLERLLTAARTAGVLSLDVGGGNEPLVYPHIRELCEIAAKLDFLDLVLATNGQLMAGDKLERLMGVITRVHLSIDAATPETYRKVRGGDYAILRRNVDAFRNLREKRNGRSPVLRVSFIIMDENRHEQEMFLEQWGNVADLVDFQSLIRYPQINDLLSDLPAAIPFCADPFRMLTVRADGTLYPCCSFYNRHFPLGAFSRTSLEEAWSGSAIAGLRRAILEDDAPVACRNCKHRTM